MIRMCARTMFHDAVDMIFCLLIYTDQLPSYGQCFVTKFYISTEVVSLISALFQLHETPFASAGVTPVLYFC